MRETLADNGGAAHPRKRSSRLPLTGKDDHGRRRSSTDPTCARRLRRSVLDASSRRCGLEPWRAAIAPRRALRHMGPHAARHRPYCRLRLPTLPSSSRGGCARPGSIAKSIRISKAAEAFARLKPKAAILSGGPASVPEAGSPRAPLAIFGGVPILAICYGQQTALRTARRQSRERSRGRVRPRRRRDRRNERAVRGRVGEGPSLAGVDEPRRPGDPLPEGFRVYAVSENAPYAVAADERRRITRPCSTPRSSTRPTARS